MSKREKALYVGLVVAVIAVAAAVVFAANEADMRRFFFAFGFRPTGEEELLGVEEARAALILDHLYADLGEAEAAYERVIAKLPSPSGEEFGDQLQEARSAVRGASSAVREARRKFQRAQALSRYYYGEIELAAGVPAPVEEGESYIFPYPPGAAP